MVFNPSTLHPAARLLLGAAIGDAFGMGYEFRGTREHIANNLILDRYIPHILGTHTAGDFTDDTHMSLGVAETLLAGHSSAVAFADQFVKNYQRNPVPGYSKRIATALATSKDGHDFIRMIESNSIANGAAMRSLPYGVPSNPDQVIQLAVTGAQITHDSPIGKFSAAAIALAAHFYYHQISSGTLFDFVLPRLNNIDVDSTKHLEQIQGLRHPDPQLLFGAPYEIGGRTLDGVPCHGLYTASAVYYLISKFNGNLFDLLKEAILLGGDTDSVASLALGLVAIDGDFTTLPKFLLDDLTAAQHSDSNLHFNYVIQTGQKLGAVYPR